MPVEQVKFPPKIVDKRKGKRIISLYSFTFLYVLKRKAGLLFGFFLRFFQSTCYILPRSTVGYICYVILSQHFESYP